MSAAVIQIAQHTPRSPQLENGFLRIANELQEAISAADVTKRELKVLNVIIRMTYGFQKKEDDISASQIGQACRMGASHVTEALNSLAKKKIITKRRGRHGCIVGIQKDYSQWPMESMPSEYLKAKAENPKSGSGYVPTAEIHEIPAPPLPNREDTPPKSGDIDHPKSGDTKDIPFKDIIPKKTSTATQALPVPFEAFWSAYPNKRNRKAALKAWTALKVDQAKLEQILAGIELAKKSREWIEGFIPHGSTFLNGERWTDEVQIAYSAEELAVITAYNEALADICGEIDPAIFTESRSGAIRHFRTLSEKPSFWLSYFKWVAQNATLPPSAGFDWLISGDGFSKVKGGQFNKR